MNAPKVMTSAKTVEVVVNAGLADEAGGELISAGVVLLVAGAPLPGGDKPGDPGLFDGGGAPIEDDRGEPAGAGAVEGGLADGEPAGERAVEGGLAEGEPAGARAVEGGFANGEPAGEGAVEGGLANGEPAGEGAVEGGLANGEPAGEGAFEGG
ncbi:hypothetical protein ACH5RR_028090 [Cinchona calisaya]|uniref:Uncharacterized protein n=1 Tax=Cinchona calisaya TaxID=153742 RepID=A0ABD2YRL7_9GENT